MVDTPASSGERVAVGRVVTAHGVHGWLKIQPYSESGTVLLSAKSWWLAPSASVHGEHGSKFHVVQCRAAGSQLLAQVEGIADRDAALALRGQAIWVPRSSFPPPEPDEYYWVDLIGCRFYGVSGSEPVLLGQVDEVFDNGAHAVLQIAQGDFTDPDTFCAHLGPGGKLRHVLVPFVAAHVHRVDLAARRIDSDWPAEF